MPIRSKPPETLRTRLKASLAALQAVDDYAEHKAACPEFDKLNFHEAPCECWKAEVAQVLARAKKEKWLKKS